jgi:hypothetical protein
MGIVDKAEANGDLVRNESGTWVYWPSGGYLSAWGMRVIARELDRRNAEWEAIVAADPAVNGSTPAPEMDAFDD